MNLPNKITLLRIALIPVFMIFAFPYPEFMQSISFPGLSFLVKYSDLIALILFVVAASTDAVDGHIARKYNLVTNFGKFMDPLADKLLVCSALICFIELGKISSIIVLVIIAREFIISGFRLIAADKGVVIAAGYWGKLKTVVQMVMIIVLLLNIPLDAFRIVEQVLIWASLALTVISLIDYLIKNKDVLKDGNQ